MVTCVTAGKLQDSLTCQRLRAALPAQAASGRTYETRVRGGARTNRRRRGATRRSTCVDLHGATRCEKDLFGGALDGARDFENAGRSGTRLRCPEKRQEETPGDGWSQARPGAAEHSIGTSKGVEREITDAVEGKRWAMGRERNRRQRVA